MTDERYQLVFMTASNSGEAAKVARALVEEGLAACVNILEGCRSIYRWKGEVVDDEEVVMLAKTNSNQFPQIEQRVRELHSYDVPEIIAVDLNDISPGYLRFLEEALSKKNA